MLPEIVTLGLRAQIVKGMPVLTNTKRSGLNVRENPDREYVTAIKKKKIKNKKSSSSSSSSSSIATIFLIVFITIIFLIFLLGYILKSSIRGMCYDP